MTEFNKTEFGDCRESMRRWAADGIKVQTCVTSPPYFGLRDYGVAGQIGLEKTPEQYVAEMVETFRAVRDVLADDGTLWLNLGDSYWGSWGNAGSRPELDGKTLNQRDKKVDYLPRGGYADFRQRPPSSYKHDSLKNKDLIGIPWRVAFALQSDGWYLRQDIIWAKPNPMPESVRDRCTKAHEYIFMLSKSSRYYFDSKAISELSNPKHFRNSAVSRRGNKNPDTGFANGRKWPTRNRRSVWTVTTKPFKGAHFATFPPDLIEPCILAGSRPGDIVLDPFMGSGTTAGVALKHGRQYLGCELNPEYGLLHEARIKKILEKR